MDRNCLSAELMDFEGIVSTPNKPPSQEIKIQYEGIIEKQAQAIKSLYRQCLILRKAVQKLKSEQIFNAEKNSSPQNIDMKKLEDVVSKQMFKQMASLLQIKPEQISKTKIMQTVKRMQWERNKKVEPIFIERLKQVRIPVPVEVIVEKQVIRYVHTNQSRDDNKPRTNHQQPENAKPNQRITKSTVVQQTNRRKASEDMGNKNGAKDYKFYRPDQKKDKTEQNDKFETQSLRNESNRDNKKLHNQTMYQKSSKYGTKSQSNCRKTPVYGQDLLEEQQKGRVIRSEQRGERNDRNEYKQNGVTQQGNKRPGNQQQQQQQQKYQFDASRFESKKHDRNVNKTRNVRNGYQQDKYDDRDEEFDRQDAYNQNGHDGRTRRGQPKYRR